LVQALSGNSQQHHNLSAPAHAIVSVSAGPNQHTPVVTATDSALNVHSDSTTGGVGGVGGVSGGSHVIAQGGGVLILLPVHQIPHRPLTAQCPSRTQHRGLKLKRPAWA
jgi:hypothetical protein